MTTEGQHLLLDIWYDEDVELIADKICDLVKEEFTVVKEVSHEFSPQGKTIVYILSESHFTLHTYPEHNYISLDIYICNPEINLLEVAEKILSIAPMLTYNAAIDKRGIPGS